MLPKILVFTPVWKRPEITQAYCLGIQRLKPLVDVLCVLSPEDDTNNQDILDKYGIEYVWCENKLGHKKNVGLREAMKRDFDYMMELNSDDIIKTELLHTYIKLMQEGVPFIGLGNFAFYEAKTGKTKHKETCATLFGIGRCYSKEMLEKAALVVDVDILESKATPNDYYKKGHKRAIHPDRVDEDIMEVKSEPYYRLWDDTADWGMDDHSRAVLSLNGYLPYVVNTDEPQAFDIKSDVNIWPYHKMAGVEYPTEKLFEGLSEEEKEYLDALRKDD